MRRTFIFVQIVQKLIFVNKASLCFHTDGLLCSCPNLKKPEETTDQLWQEKKKVQYIVNIRNT